MFATLGNIAAGCVLLSGRGEMRFVEPRLSLVSQRENLHSAKKKHRRFIIRQ